MANCAYVFEARPNERIFEIKRSKWICVENMWWYMLELDGEPNEKHVFTKMWQPPKQKGLEIMCLTNLRCPYACLYCEKKPKHNFYAVLEKVPRLPDE